MDTPEATQLFEMKVKSEVQRTQRYISRQAYSGRFSYTRLCDGIRMSKRLAEEFEALGYETHCTDEQLKVFWR